MSELRREMHKYIDTMPENRLEVLKPLLSLLSDDDGDYIIETDLTEEEKAILRHARETHRPEDYISLSDIDWS